MTERCDFGIGQCIDQRYTVTKNLGEGAFGKVFQVTDSAGQIYALKLLKLWEVHPEIRTQLANRFEMEYQTGQIESPYLVHSVGHGFVKGNPYILMEFCPNGDLTHAPKNTDWNLVGQQVLLGLRALHRCGKVHRDLKPENVLVKRDGTAALTDFGISGDRNKRMTERNLLGKPTQIFGTYAYMPPEQVKPERGDATVLPTTDIWSFGVMMYQLLTGALPFGSLNDENELAMYIKNGRNGDWNRSLLTLSVYGTMYREVIEGCLCPNFKQRLQSVDEVLGMLPKTRQVQSSFAHDDLTTPEHISGYRLKIMQGEEYGRTYDLTQLATRYGILTIGRQDFTVDNIIKIREEESIYISRKHCTLEYDISAGAWYIRDGQWDRSASNGWKRSLNGTFVNSSEVMSDGKRLAVGDIISIGDTKLRMEAY